MLRKILLPALLAFAGSAVLAQTAAPAASFEVASIRANDDTQRGGRIVTAPGTLTITNQTLRDCIQWAYEVQVVQIQAPAWLNDARFTITAKAADPANDDRLRLMLRSLLAERFAVKLHHEQKELPMYAMTLAKGEPKFHETGPKDASKFVESKSEGPSNFTRDKTGMIAERVRMSEVADKLSEPLQRPVIDKTGLKGRYDIRIDVTAYLTEQGGDGGGPRLNDPISIIFNAFQGQMGLKLEAGKESVDYLVVDSANKTPSEN